MAEQYDDDNRFVLFKQDKGNNANRPDYTGTIKIEGKEWRLAAWISESKGGLKYLRGNVDDTIENKVNITTRDSVGNSNNTVVSGAEDIPF